MSAIEDLIKMLQSNNPMERYDACQELGALQSISLEALTALRLAANDTNPDVANATQRALILHSEMVEKNDSNKQSRSEGVQPEQSQAQEWKSNLRVFGLIFFLMSIFGYGELSFGAMAFWVMKGTCETLMTGSNFITVFFPVGAVIVLLVANIMHKKKYHADANTLIYILIALYLISFSIRLFVFWIPHMGYLPMINNWPVFQNSYNLVCGGE